VEYARKIAEETKRKEEAEQLIELLEREERELIDRLKKTQKLQQHVSFDISFDFVIGVVGVSRIKIMSGVWGSPEFAGMLILNQFEPLSHSPHQFVCLFHFVTLLVINGKDHARYRLMVFYEILSALDDLQYSDTVIRVLHLS
jgi:hypothetical protein